MNDKTSNNKLYAIGADIGGTHITSSVVDLTNKSIVSNSIFHQKVDAAGWPSDVIPVWASCLQKSLEMVPADQLTGVGLAMPGPFDYKNGVSQITGLAKYERLFGLNVKHALADQLGLNMEAVRLMNDANCFLFGESWITEKTYQRIIGITLGTGFGAGFFKDGQIVETGKGVPPNAEFFPVPFREETSEDYISSRGILRAYHQKTGQQLSGVKDIAELATQGNDQALSTLAEFGVTLGAFLGYWLKTFEAEALIIGGNISQAHALFLPTFKKTIAEQSIEVDVILSQLLDKAGILGAGRLFAPETKMDVPIKQDIESIKFSYPNGQQFDNLEALVEWLPTQRPVSITGASRLPWSAINAALTKKLKLKNKSAFLYETSPNAINKVPGYDLAKIKPDPTANHCILLGPLANEAGWDAIEIQVSY